MKTWTEEQIEDLKKSYQNTDTSVLAERYSKTRKAVKTKAQNLGLRKNSKHKFSGSEIEQLKQLYADYSTAEIAKIMGLPKGAIYRKANALGLLKSKECVREVHCIVARNNTGFLKHSFQKGNISHNKGKRQTEYMSAEGIERTKSSQFKRGHLPHNTKSDFAISKRVHKQTGIPYLYIRTGLGKWILYQRYVWEQAHGAIPRGVNIQFKDGNTLNCELSNLYAIDRKNQMLDNSGSLRLVDGMIAVYLSGKRGKDKAEIKEFKKYPDLLDLKRKQLILNRTIKKQRNGTK
ncbi:MAG: HNH endonuclease [Prevotellaceae bacterium]|jgi:hypothetical protein|nr:HNH endonuclease [Prevotellaceae bacterium]